MSSPTNGLLPNGHRIDAKFEQSEIEIYDRIEQRSHNTN